MTKTRREIGTQVSPETWLTEKQRRAVMSNFGVWLVAVTFLVTGHMSAQAKKICVATGQETGTYHKVGQSLRNGDSSIEVVSTSGSMENIRAVEDDVYQFGIVQSDILQHFRQGQDYKRTKVVGTIYREPVYIVIRSKLHLTRIDELRGKKVAIGLLGSGTRHTSEVMLGLFGISLDELRASTLTYGEIAQSLEDESIDAAFIVILRMPKGIEDLIRVNKAYCLKIDKSDLIKMARAHPNLYTLVSVPDPADVNKRLLTVSVSSVLITNCVADATMVLRFARRLHDESFRTSDFFENYQLYWERDPFVLYREVATSDLLHETALDYYKSSNLITQYRIRQVARFWFPFLLCLTLLLLILYKRTRLIIRNDSWIWITYALLVIIGVGYFWLYLCESNVGNPDITGSPIDLFKMVLLVFKAGEVLCVTEVGRCVKIVVLIASGVFVATMTAKIAAYFVGLRMLEVLKMVPKRNKLNGHVVLCNWTSKIEGVIRELRSGFVERRIIIVLTKPTPETSHELPDIPEYDDVYVIVGDPADDKYLQRANIQTADSMLVLADTVHSDDPDTISLMILLSARKVLSADEDTQKKPNIVVEALNPVFADHMYEAGADEVVAYTDIAHKLLAQAIITPGAIGFVREILTATGDSNEVYILRVPKEYEGVSFQEFACRIMNKHSTTSNPVTAIGVRSAGKLYINPRHAQFSKINPGDEAIVLAWLRPTGL